MKEDLYFEQIHPFVRYARFLELNRQTGFPPFIPYDCRLFYTYEGNGQIFLNNKVYEMPKGSLMIFQSATPYQLLNENSACYLAFNFDFTYQQFKIKQPIPPDIPEKYNGSAVLEQLNFIDQPCFNKPVYLNRMEAIEKQLLETEREFKHKRLYFNHKVSALFTDVLLKTAHRINFPDPNATAAMEKVDEIIEYIQNHYAEQISNGDVGKKFNFHPNYINCLITAYTGLSLHRYVTSVRISKAIELLEATTMQIKEIAYAVGFQDICHFSRQFKSITGCSPRDFRK